MPSVSRFLGGGLGAYLVVQLLSHVSAASAFISAPHPSSGLPTHARTRTRAYAQGIVCSGVQSVAIVGGSIAGCATAAALKRIAGLPSEAITVYEKSGEDEWRSSSAGAGLIITPNGFQAMQHVDPQLPLDFKASSTELFGSVGLDTQGKEVAKPYQTDYKGKYGHALHFGRWAELRRCWASRLDSNMVKTGWELEELEEEGGRHVLRFSNGQRVEADLLVLADGIKSSSRKILTNKFGVPWQEKFLGRTVFRSVAPIVPPEQYQLKEGYSQSIVNDQGRRFAVFPAGKGYTYWAATFLDDEAGNPRYDGMALDDMKRELVKDLADVPRMQDLIQRTDVKLVTVSRMADAEPVRFFGRGAVAFVGDAAHPLDASLGQGSGMAMEDAVQLAYCVRAARSQGARAVVDMYAEAREERVAVIQDSARKEAAATYKMQNTTSPVDWLDWLYNFQPEQY